MRFLSTPRRPASSIGGRGVGLVTERCREVPEDIGELLGLVRSQVAGELVVRSDDFDVGGFAVGFFGQASQERLEPSLPLSTDAFLPGATVEWDRVAFARVPAVVGEAVVLDAPRRAVRGTVSLVRTARGDRP